MASLVEESARRGMRRLGNIWFEKLSKHPLMKKVKKVTVTET